MKFLVVVLAIVAAAESRQCVPNTIFPEYCNTCWCSADGLSAKCTNVVCASGQWNKDGTLKPLFPEKTQLVCEPGTTFYDYCNTCTCLPNGKTAVCTLMYCDERVWNKDGTLKLANAENKNSDRYCEPNARFEQYCDRCECSTDGRYAVCTEKTGCDPKIWNEDGTLKFGLRSGQNCQPNLPFYDRCNHCRCGLNGKEAACTKMACDNYWIRRAESPIHVFNP